MKSVNLKKLFFFLQGLVAVAAFTRCNKEPEFIPPVYSSTVIEEFWLERSAANPNLNRPYQGMVLGDSAVHLVVDYGTDITSLEPTIFSAADSISPKGNQNFSHPVQYKVWANGKSATYIVRISVSTVQFPVIRTIAAGFAHIIAIKNDGTLWVCGNNASGQLGLGDYSSRNLFTQAPIYDVEKVFTGDAATIIKLKDGTAWGAGNQYGQLGLGHKNAIANFTRVPFLDDATQLAITFNEVFALKPGGILWGAGLNRGSILAQGDDQLHATFVKIPVSDVKNISACASHIVVQKNNGEVWAWGDNFAGQLGVGDKLIRKTPVLLSTPSIGVASIFAGGSTTFLLDNSGTIWGTGANVAGQLALGDITNRETFTLVSSLSDKSIVTIIPRSGATGFVDVNGTMWNTGNNSFGLMGLGTKTAVPYTHPVQLPGFTTMSAGGYGSTSFALKPDGTLWAWGSNLSGALGTGTDTTSISSPIQIK